MKYQELLAKNIKELRLKHNLTQEVFAEKIIRIHRFGFACNGHRAYPQFHAAYQLFAYGNHRVYLLRGRVDYRYGAVQPRRGHRNDSYGRTNRFWAFQIGQV